MSIQIDLLTQDQETRYEELLYSVEHSLLYVSLAYRDFLKRILVGSQDLYLVAYESGRIVGALPSFIKRNVTYGNVINSLPFYGSNGGVIIAPEASDKEIVKLSLMRAIHSLAAEKSVVASTLISNPLAADVEFYEAYSQYTLRDERIGQVAPLPTGWRDDSELQDVLMSMFHKKTRNSIRKAQKSNIIIYHSESLEAMRTLAELHRQNIEAIGGLPKPWSVFTAIQETFTYDRDYRVYLAEKDGAVIAALLVFFYNRTAEYFTPATQVDFRVYQPMSLLVYESMQEAARRGCRYWNWGGTWLTQKGVYNFKKRWGTEDMPYRYYIRCYTDISHLLCMSPAELLAEYPYFYVIPFSELNSQRGG